MSAQERTETQVTAGQVALRMVGATIGYDGAAVSSGLDVDVPDGGFTVIVGPNACGKSTLLRALARLLRPEAGTVVLDGKDIYARPAKEVARRLGLLPQSSLAPDGITVADLVARGRYPHQSFLRQWTPADEQAVTQALAATRIADLAGRRVDSLSGGQRQRVWVALLLTQQTPVMLLDEPTTFLDVAHQLDLLELFSELHRAGRTLVAVLHDLNQAARYATYLIAMKGGQVVAAGPPAEVVSAGLVREVFGLDCVVTTVPELAAPIVVPLGRSVIPGALPAKTPVTGPAAGG